MYLRLNIVENKSLWDIGVVEILLKTLYDKGNEGVYCNYNVCMPSKCGHIESSGFIFRKQFNFYEEKVT